VRTSHPLHWTRWCSPAQSINETRANCDTVRFITQKLYLKHSGLVLGYVLDNTVTREISHVHGLALDCPWLTPAAVFQKIQVIIEQKVPSPETDRLCPLMVLKRKLPYTGSRKICLAKKISCVLPKRQTERKGWKRKQGKKVPIEKPKHQNGTNTHKKSKTKRIRKIQALPTQKRLKRRNQKPPTESQTPRKRKKKEKKKHTN
jgi:hypothetical protein